jgi:Zn finger protein HypA/HybF involved in hydrogenase expression
MVVSDWRKEVNSGISKITKELKILDAREGKLRCSKCNTKLRHTIYGKFFCPKCVENKF